MAASQVRQVDQLKASVLVLFLSAVCQSLRIVSFSVTQLPGPAPHCRLGTPTAHR
jgi:hypothetical protein